MDDRSIASTAEHLTRALDDSDRFHRDTGLGRVFHPGKVSFREVSQTDSLHVVLHGSRVSAHLDHISPLKSRPDGSFRYSWFRVLAHNLSGMASDVVHLVRGRRRDQRCNLECELVWVDDEPPA